MQENDAWGSINRYVYTYLCFLLKKSLQAQVHGGETQAEPSSHPEMRTELRVQEGQGVWNGQGWEPERGGLQKFPLKPTADHWSECACEEHQAKDKKH